MRALLIFSALLFGGAPVAVNAQDFQDKTIRFVVGYSPGGLFDLYTRVIARHFAKHVSGNPTVIVENMTGASGIIAANYVYNVAKPDGLTIGAWAAPLVLQHIMGTKRLDSTAASSVIWACQAHTTPSARLTRKAASQIWTTGLPPNGR